jgi:hypothetical protein
MKSVQRADEGLEPPGNTVLARKPVPCLKEAVSEHCDSERNDNDNQPNDPIDAARCGRTD